MHVRGFQTGAFMANCYVVSKDTSGPCVIIDPGQGSFDRLAEMIDEKFLEPVAVLATHGHYDHVADAARVADEFEADLYLHPADWGLLADPASGASEELRAALGGDLPPVEPKYPIVELRPGFMEIDDFRYRIEVRHCPGHTPGSVLLSFEEVLDDGGLSRLVFTGDTLFAGSVGRFDLPGGDIDQLKRSLWEQVLTFDDETMLMPGHGPHTTIGQERATNPSLLGLKAEKDG